MKKFTLLLFVTAICMVSSISTAQAGIPIFYSTGANYEEQVQLPDSITSDAGNKMSFGVTFDQFSIFYVPIWNSGEIQYALIEDAADTYYILTSEEAQSFAEEFGFTIDDEPSLSLWNRFGGKVIILLLIAAGLYSKFFMKSDDEEETEEVASEVKKEE